MPIAHASNQAQLLGAQGGWLSNQAQLLGAQGGWLSNQAQPLGAQAEELKERIAEGAEIVLEQALLR